MGGGGSGPTRCGAGGGCLLETAPLGVAGARRAGGGGRELSEPLSARPAAASGDELGGGWCGGDPSASGLLSPGWHIRINLIL